MGERGERGQEEREREIVEMMRSKRFLDRMN
jgi:hypothetical protein